MMRPWTRTLRALPALVFVAGCASPVDHYYTLRPAQVPGADHARPTDRVLAVGPVTIPEELDREGWVVRTDDTSMQVYQHRLWTQGLASEVAQAIADQLNGALAASGDPALGELWADGNPSNPAVDPTVVPPHALRARVQVLRFESRFTPAPAISDSVRWTLECTGAESADAPAPLRFHVLRSAVRDVTRAVGGDDADAGNDDARRFDRLARAHGETLRAVASDIAAAVGETAADRAQACPDR